MIQVLPTGQKRWHKFSDLGAGNSASTCAGTQVLMSGHKK